MSTENNGKATIWCNGQPTTLTNGAYSAEVNSIVVSEGDVYAVGHEMNEDNNSVAMLWKNGEGTALSSGQNLANANTVYIEDNDVYVIGKELDGMDDKAILWKNGEVIKRVNEVKFKGSGIVLALALSNGFNVASTKSVYVTGASKNVVINGEKINKFVIKMWKNNIPTILNKVNNTAIANSVYTLEDNVYVAGAVITNESAPIAIATVWKNGEPITFDKNNFGSVANAVHVSENNIYVAGKKMNREKKPAAILWKNGKAIELSNGFYQAEAKSVFVSGDNVYVAGYLE